MSHRREQKETLRRERERREAEAKAAEQRKRLVGIVAAVVLAVVAIVVVVVVAGGGGGDGGSGVKGNQDIFPSGGSVAKQKVFDLSKAAAAAGCELKTNKAVSRSHITDINQKVNYNTDPPNSGKHYYLPAEDGLYNGPAPKDTQLVHAQEHGRVITWVKPSLPRDVRQQIRALFDEDSYQMIVVQRSNMPYAIAATAWGADPTPLGTGYTMSCASWNDKVVDALRAFRDEHRSNGPEPIP